MKAIKQAYRTYLGGNVESNTLYLFIIEKVTGADGVVGDMPRGKQFGYLFPGADIRTLAHEIGHGAFNLEHPFDRPLRGEFDKGQLTHCLMDYASGTEFCKLEWDAINAPGLVIGLLETDEAGMALDLQRVKEKIKEILKDLTLNSGHAMLAVIIDGIYIDNFIDWSFAKWTIADIQDVMKAINEYLNNKDIAKLMEAISKILAKRSNNSEASQLMNMTSLAWIESLKTENISSATALTNSMIVSNKDEATVIFGLLFEFKYGIGSEVREFDKNSVLTKGILDFYIVDDGRKYFYDTRSEYPVNKLYEHPIKIGTEEGAFDEKFIPVYGNIKAGTSLIQQYVGGCYIEMIPNNAGSQMEVIVYNDMNLKSLVAHYLYLNDLSSLKPFPEKYPRIQGTITPLGETRQIFRWTENIDSTKFNTK